MVTKLSFISSFDKVKMAPKKKARVDPDSTEANLNWTDDEVELLLGVVRAYSSQKDYEGLEWESVKINAPISVKPEGGGGGRA